MLRYLLCYCSPFGIALDLTDSHSIPDHIDARRVQLLHSGMSCGVCISLFIHLPPHNYINVSFLSWLLQALLGQPQCRKSWMQSSHTACMWVPPFNTQSRIQAPIKLAANCWNSTGILEVSGINEQETAIDTVTARARPSGGKEMGLWNAQSST